MNNTKNLVLPNELENIFDKLKKNSINSIVIGGYIRDFFLGIDSKDIDIELYGISSFDKLEAILEEFGSVNSVGKSFGVCKLSLKNFEIDFTLPRSDSKISSGHRGFDILIDSSLDFKTATSRRDFTINAIGFEAQTKKLLDPFNGLVDLENRVLRAVDINKFSEDPLRVLRAVSFHSRLNFKLDNELFHLCKNICENSGLSELSKERIFIEIKKILLKSKKPSLGFKLLREFRGLEFFSTFNDLDKRSFNNTLDAIDFMVKLKTEDEKTNTLLMLALLCYKLNNKQTVEFITNLTNEKDLSKKILSFKSSVFKTNYTDSELYHLATQINIEHFLIYSQSINSQLSEAIFIGIKKRAIALNILNKKAKPFLQGRDILDLGIKPSEEFSKILLLAYNAQLNLEVREYGEAKEWLRRYLNP